MTMTERRRAKKLQDVTYLYSRGCRLWLALTGSSAVQLIILTIIIFAGRADDQLFIMSPCMSMFGILPFFAGIVTMGIDNTANERVFRQAYHSSSTPLTFLCCTPFKARDMANLKFSLWEKSAAVNMLMVTVGHIAALIAEAQGFSIYHGVSGLFTRMAFIAEILLMTPYILKNNVISVMS